MDTWTDRCMNAWVDRSLDNPIMHPTPSVKGITTQYHEVNHSFPATHTQSGNHTLKMQQLSYFRAALPVFPTQTHQTEDVHCHVGCGDFQIKLISLNCIGFSN